MCEMRDIAEAAHHSALPSVDARNPAAREGLQQDLENNEIFHGRISRAGRPDLRYRVTSDDREIHLHLTVSLPVPAGCRVRTPRAASSAVPTLLRDLPGQAQELLIEYLQPAIGEER
jgi:hypothetical protein